MDGQRGCSEGEGGSEGDKRAAEVKATSLGGVSGGQPAVDLDEVCMLSCRLKISLKQLLVVEAETHLDGKAAIVAADALAHRGCHGCNISRGSEEAATCPPASKQSLRVTCRFAG